MNDSLREFSLEGTRALVTGASRGLGHAIAVAFANAGADVGCVSSGEGGSSETAARVRETGRRAWEFAADLSDRKAVLDLAERAEDEMGGVGILVNNAGTIRRRPAAEYPADDWDVVMRTNIDSAFFLSQSIGRKMLERKRGKIINVASLLSFSGGITVPAYTASKHALAGLTKALANEWAGSGVQVNAIAPGYFATDNTAALRADPKRSAEILSRIPAGRWGEPKDITGAVVFLASPAADYVNGHVLVVDGGWMAR
ncbi:MAG TPA: 2-dehydro-3-deoxy-D-gluconate 5-dehydrogenase KduD [Gemmatimonadaceae bacterium]|nr:2-dehydro-3-deoxy-D-gluconate 5-dehydrogenase KduD [Gemmatimonadaceae bacterium]